MGAGQEGPIPPLEILHFGCGTSSLARISSRPCLKKGYGPK